MMKKKQKFIMVSVNSDRVPDGYFGVTALGHKVFTYLFIYSFILISMWY